MLLLANAGLDGVSVDGDTITLGATASVNDLLDLGVDALTACARNLADYEIRGQATVAGNLCVGRDHEAPRGDLQGCLLALDAQVRSAGADGERTEPLEDFLAERRGRLVLEVSFERPAASAFAALEYPHTHEYTVLAVTGARTASGETRLAATGVAGLGHPPSRGGGAGVGSPSRRCCSRRGRQLRRRRGRVGLVPRADASRARPTCPLEPSGARMNLTVNGLDATVESGPLTSLLDVLREELGITSPKAGCEQGGCGACTVLVDGEPRRSCLTPVASVDGAAITTVEGLGSPENMAPIQQAFTHHYAAQCGFCTSGMMMAAQAYIDRGGSADPVASRTPSAATSAAAPAT